MKSVFICKNSRNLESWITPLAHSTQPNGKNKDGHLSKKFNNGNSIKMLWHKNKRNV